MEVRSRPSDSYSALPVLPPRSHESLRVVFFLVKTCSVKPLHRRRVSFRTDRPGRGRGELVDPTGDVPPRLVDSPRPGSPGGWGPGSSRKPSVRREERETHTQTVDVEGKKEGGTEGETEREREGGKELRSTL